MGRLDRSYVYNAGKRDHTKPMIVHYKGQRRRQLWPAGTVERFVNLQGAVVQCVLVPPGTPGAPEQVAQARAKLRNHRTQEGDIVGFIEHGKCPLKSGIADHDSVIAEECERARYACGPACKEQPITFQKTAKGVEYFDGCPHVQWMIDERRKIARAKQQARTKRQKTMHEIEQAKLAAAEQQAQDTRKLLEKVVEKIDAAAPKASKSSKVQESAE